MKGRRIGPLAAIGFLVILVAAATGGSGAPQFRESSLSSPMPESTVPVTIDTVPTGLQFALDGSMHTAPYTFDCDVGSSHLLDVADPQAGGPGTRWVFAYWSDGSTSHARTIVCDVPATYTAVFRMQYYLTVGTNYGTVDPPGGWFDPGTPVILSWLPPAPAPEVRYAFNGWLGAGAGSYTGAANPVTITMNGPITEIADTFREFLFVFDTNPTGLVIVIDGGPYTFAPQIVWWSEGSTHVVACPKNQGPGGNVTYEFREWDDGATDNPRVFTASGPESRTCFYDLVPGPFPVNVNESRVGLPGIPDPGIPSLVGLAPPNPAASRWAAPGVRSPLPERPPTD